MSEIARIGVVGAGQMGNGIAHVCALAGYDVHLNDISEDALSAGMKTIEANMTRQVSRDMISHEDMSKAMSRIHTSTSLDGFGDVNLAIEAATEKREIKEGIFKSLCDAVPANAYLATNTSSISITRISLNSASPSPGWP